MCTLAAVVAFLGYMPPAGTEIVIPRSKLDEYSFAQQAVARRCARKYGIRWRVDWER